MTKTLLASLTLSTLVFSPITMAQSNCDPSTETACQTKIEQECRYYLMDDMDDDFDYKEEGYSDFSDTDDMDDDLEGMNDEDYLVSDLQTLDLTKEQQTLLNEWKSYNASFDEGWVKLCMSHENKDKSVSDQLNWEEANLKSDLAYIEQSRIFIDKINASLTNNQKQELVQLGLMQLLP